MAPDVLPLFTNILTTVWKSVRVITFVIINLFFPSIIQYLKLASQVSISLVLIIPEKEKSVTMKNFQFISMQNNSM